MTARVDVKPELLRWARERARLDLAVLVRRFPRYLEWERGTARPTLKQLEAFARTSRAPVGYLFLSEAPIEEVPIPDFRTVGDSEIKSILIANHPAFRRLATLTKTRYRVYFSTKVEMEAWLNARGWVATSEERLDPDSVGEWSHDSWSKYLKFKKEIFGEDGRLLRYTAEEWDDEWIELASSLPVLTDDDIPF